MFHAAAVVATGNELPHAAAEATEAAAPKATEATTAAPTAIAGTPTHGYAATREGAMAGFARSDQTHHTGRPSSSTPDFERPRALAYFGWQV